MRRRFPSRLPCPNFRLMSHPLPASIDETLSLLTRGGYIAERELATVLYLCLKLERPLFLEGEPGTGKTRSPRSLPRR